MPCLHDSSSHDTVADKSEFTSFVDHCLASSPRPQSHRRISGKNSFTRVLDSPQHCIMFRLPRNATVSQRDGVLTYNYSPLVLEMVGSGPDSWGNILLSSSAAGMLSHGKISSSRGCGPVSADGWAKKGVKNRIDDLGRGLES